MRSSKRESISATRDASRGGETQVYPEAARDEMGARMKAVEMKPVERKPVTVARGRRRRE